MMQLRNYRHELRVDDGVHGFLQNGCGRPIDGSFLATRQCNGPVSESRSSPSPGPQSAIPTVGAAETLSSTSIQQSCSPDIFLKASQAVFGCQASSSCGGSSLGKSWMTLRLSSSYRRRRYGSLDVDVDDYESDGRPSAFAGLGSPFEDVNDTTSASEGEFDLKRSTSASDDDIESQRRRRRRQRRKNTSRDLQLVDVVICMS